MDFIEEYLGEFILVIAMFVLRLFGRSESADKIAKKLKKKKAKLEKKAEKQIVKVDKTINELNGLKRED